MRPTRQTQKGSYDAKTWPPKKRRRTEAKKVFFCKKRGENKTQESSRQVFASYFLRYIHYVTCLLALMTLMH